MGTHQGPDLSRSELIARVLGCFREMPGLCVQVWEAARLFGLGEQACRVVLEDLVRQGLLRRSSDKYACP